MEQLELSSPITRTLSLKSPLNLANLELSSPLSTTLSLSSTISTSLELRSIIELEEVLE